MVTCLVTTGAAQGVRRVNKPLLLPGDRDKGMGDECGNGSVNIMVTVSPVTEEWLGVTECTATVHHGQGLTGSDKTWPKHKLMQAVTGMLCGPRPVQCHQLHRNAQENGH